MYCIESKDDAGLAGVVGAAWPLEQAAHFKRMRTHIYQNTVNLTYRTNHSISPALLSFGQNAING